LFATQDFPDGQSVLTMHATSPEQEPAPEPVAQCVPLMLLSNHPLSMQQ
jgi:hypothetical protein